MLKLYIAFVVGAVALVGVGLVLTSATQPRPVSYYVAHPAEDARVYTVCADTGQRSVDCNNAVEARWQLQTAAVLQSIPANVRWG